MKFAAWFSWLQSLTMCGVIAVGIMFGLGSCTVGLEYPHTAPYTAPNEVQKAFPPVAVSTGTLAGSAPVAALLPVEPYVSPFGAREVEIVSGFGKRDVMVQVKPPVAVPGQPALPVTGALQSKTEMHDGVDYAVSPGTEVRSSRSGKVIFAGVSKMYQSRTDKNIQYRLVIIRHADGQSSRYVHLNFLRVRPGQDVKSGQVLGTVAASDEGSVPVLHFEIRTVQGQAVDPETVFVESIKP
jgi:murein DD-endopeptidase MepM/ murein hydrolase activator NlpD